MSEGSLWHDAMSETAPGGTKPGENAGPLVYVVDDEPMLLELAAAILEPEGYRIETFQDPKIALRAYSAAEPRPELLITDYAMHTMTGMELIDQFRRLNPRQKIVLVSGTVTEEIFTGSPVKPDRFLAKPYQPFQLSRIVKEVLEAK
jgi:CheY-like chemotaxis protein